MRINWSSGKTSGVFVALIWLAGVIVLIFKLMK